MQKILMVSALALLTACDLDGIFGPTLTPLDDPRNQEGYQPLSMPVPNTTRDVRFESASLWPEGAKGFFKDHRAAQVGDIITVLINVKDGATISNKSNHKREHTESIKLPQIAGLDVKKLLNKDANKDPLVDAQSKPEFKGSGDITRSEFITLNVAAVVTQTLPNGNLVIRGSQEILVNTEVRVLNVTGIIRRGDIGADNTIRHDRIAEARIYYSGRGDISRSQRGRLGFHLMDSFSPL